MARSTLAILTISAAVLLGLARRSVMNKAHTVLPEGRTIAITNKDNAKRHVYTKTTEDTSGEYITIEMLFGPEIPGFLPGKSASPPVHTHPHQTECFDVLRGTMGYYLDGKEHTVERGSEFNPVCIPPATPHTFWNAANETELEASITLRPALRGEEFFRTIIGLETDYGTLDNVNPLQLLVTFVGGDVQLANVPAAVWKVMKYVIAPAAEDGLGFKPFYDEYTHMTKG